MYPEFHDLTNDMSFLLNPNDFVKNGMYLQYLAANKNHSRFLVEVQYNCLKGIQADSQEDCWRIWQLDNIEKLIGSMFIGLCIIVIAEE